MELLLVNPPDTAIGYIFSLLGKEVDVTVVITSSAVQNELLDRDLIKVIDLETSEWDKSQTIISAISWNKAGQQFLDSIADQIVLKNPAETADARMNLYYRPDMQDGAYMVDTISYQGRHILCSVMIKTEQTWAFVQDQSNQQFIDNIETAFQILDETGIINGPCRVFIDQDSKIVKPSLPDWLFIENQVTKKFLDIWPDVISLQTESPKKAFLKFYEWAETHGPSKKFVLEH